MEIKGEEITKVKTEAKPPTEPSAPEIRLYEQTIETINKQSEISFPDLNAFLRNKDEIWTRINQMVRDHCPPNTVPDYPIYSPGCGTEILKPINDQFSIASQQLKSANESFLPSSPHAVNMLWQNWMMVAEALFIQLTRFAKQLPGFAELHIDDKIVLLKAARIEVSALMA